MKYELILVLSLLSGCSFPEDRVSIPPFPKGFAITPEATNVDENHTVESMRLTMIISSRKDKFDNSIAIDAFKQQARRMLRMDDATRAELLRVGISKLADDTDFAPAFKDELLAYAAEILTTRLRNLENPAYTEPLYPKTDIALRDQVVDFSLLYLLVLKPHGLHLMNMPEGVCSLNAEGNRTEDAYAVLSNNGTDFFFTYARSENCKKYLIGTLSLVPGATGNLKLIKNHLDGLLAVRGPRVAEGVPPGRLTSLVDEGILLNEWLSNSKDRLDWPDIIAKCLLEDYRFSCLTTLYKDMGVWPASNTELGIMATKKAVAWLEGSINRTEEQDERLKVLRERLEKKIVIPYKLPEPKIKGAHPFLGF